MEENNLNESSNDINTTNNTEFGGNPNIDGGLGQTNAQAPYDKRENGEKPRIIKTDEGSKTGQDKCPKCGATDISLNPKTGKLRCNFCRFEFEPEAIKGLETDIANLYGEVMGSGACDIDENASNIVTLKCSSCGAEVVIDTSENTQARCHWCRNTLSINEQIPNGAVPDMVLPFKVRKEDAKAKIENFVGKRKFYAHPKFKEEFTTENVMGVYFPYMVVDVNSHAKFIGQGEHEVRSYTVRHGDSEETRYDADLYDVERDFDLTIEGLTVESNTDRLKRDSTKTNNIINSIMPFDVENSVKFNSNYLKGCTSEKRDINVDELKPMIEAQSKDIARFAANDSLGYYDRGVNWKTQEMDIKGRQWKSAYLPVWLYSYQEKKNGNSTMHYVAVNARTSETMGSVPIHIPKLLGVSLALEVLGILLMNFADDFKYRWLFLLIGIIYYIYIYFRYRNSNARHHHESETKREVFNMNKRDEFVKHEKGLSRSRIDGANNEEVTGQNIGEKILKNIK